MIFQCYPDTDMLYIKLTDKISTESEEAAPGIVFDFDETRNAQQRLAISPLKRELGGFSKRCLGKPFLTMEN